MPVARDHLRRDRLRLEPEPFARDALDLRIDRGVGADRSGELADPAAVERSAHAVARPVELERPPGELPAERRRLGMDPVRAADADRVTVLLREPDDRSECGVDALDDQPAGVLNLQGERGVDDVGRGEAVVEPAALGADLFGDGVDECCKVVVGRLLDLGNTLRRRNARARADRGDVARRHDPKLCPCVERGQLHVEPARQLALFRPDPAHLRTGVAGDHLEQSRAGSGERDDACREHGRVLRVVDADGRDGDTRRHLDDREQGVEAVEHRHGRAERHADHRQLRVCRHDAR